MMCRGCGNSLPLQGESTAPCARCFMIAELTEELIRKQVREDLEADKRAQPCHGARDIAAVGRGRGARR
jgi:hypothetical protein